MLRKSPIPQIPIIYHSRRDLEHPDHERIEAFKSIAEVLEWEKDLRGEFFGNRKLIARERKTENTADDRLQEIWFRGTKKHFLLAPGIYRKEITDLANETNRDWLFGLPPPSDAAVALELKRLNVERDMMLTFERESAPCSNTLSSRSSIFSRGTTACRADYSTGRLVRSLRCSCVCSPSRGARRAKKPSRKSNQKTMA
jgi:hypothetical protein